MKHREEAVGLLDPAGDDEPQDTTQTPVTATPLTYTQLRLLAECTVGLGNEKEATFAATATDLVWLSPQEQPGPSAVLVPARNLGKYPKITQVTLAGTWTPPPSSGVAPVTGSVNAVQHGADALFWSDSAVQKFVVPYVASCSGAGAGAALNQLQSAWNGYPTGSMGMFALMHRTPDEGQPVSLDSRLAFVQAAAGGTNLDVLPLSGYGGEKSASTSPEPLVGTFEQAAPVTPYPEYHVLRAMAEWSESIYPALGYPNGIAYFTVTPGMTEVPEPSLEMPILAPGQVMIPAGTPSTPGDRPIPASVVIQPKDGSEHNLTVLADAAFWSTGSIQQFLLPYYASVRGMECVEELRTIVKCWELNIEHKAQTASTSATEEEEEVEVVAVYALVHLPMSAWMTEAEVEEALLGTLHESQRRRLLAHRAGSSKTDWLSAKQRLGVLHRHRGRTHLLRLGDFTVLHPQYF